MKLKQVHEMTHPTLRGKRHRTQKPEATAEDLLATLESEAEEEEEFCENK